MLDFEDVCVLIPTLNEATTIATVIDSFAAEGFEDILVIDGNSTDGTARVAQEHGAEVIIQSESGKGQAVRQGIETTEKRIILLVDGDRTYQAEDGPKLVAPIIEGEAEHVIGNRFADLRPGAITRLNRIGNRLINLVFSLIHGRNLQDILSGYRAFTANSIDRMNLSAEGFGIETEMAVECVRNNISTTVVDITYSPRPDRSSTKLNPIRDGGIILATLWRLARTNNPLFYFGSLGVLSMAVATVVGLFVGYEWFIRGVPHQVMAMVAAFGVLFGVQLLTFGVLSDMILRLYR